MTAPPASRRTRLVLLARALRRVFPADSSGRICMAIIMQAAFDLSARREAASARAYLSLPRIPAAVAAGVDSEYIRELLRKGGLL